MIPTAADTRRISTSTWLAILQPWPEVDQSIHQRLARLGDAAPGQDVLWVGCGSGRSVLWWADRFGGRVEGIDVDQAAIERGEAAARKAGLAGRVTFQVAEPTDLPHQDRVFDTVILHGLHLAGADPVGALREAVRVVRPLGTVMALMPAWLDTPDPDEAALLARIGVQPQLPVEWKSRLREAGVVELVIEEAAPDAGWIAYRWTGLLVRAWRAAGWVGLRTAVSPPVRAFRRLARSRQLGLSLLKGSRWPH